MFTKLDIYDILNQCYNFLEAIEKQEGQMEKICLGVCIVLNVITSIQAMTCSGRTHIVPPSEVGKHLEGSILKTIENVGHNDCFDECIRRVSCKSLNFQKDQLTCELNTAVGRESGDYTVNVNYDYTSMAGQRQVIDIVLNGCCLYI